MSQIALSACPASLSPLLASETSAQQMFDPGFQVIAELDLRIMETPVSQSERPLRSDYLTCKTDSTCDGSDAC